MSPVWNLRRFKYPSKMKSSVKYVLAASLSLLLFPVICSCVAETDAHQAKVGSTSPIVDDDPSLLEVGRYASMPKNPVKPREIKFVSYNIRWRGGESLNELIDHLRTDPEFQGAAVIALQEVDRRRKRTGNVNTARLIAEQLSLNYAWAAPPSPADTRANAKPSEEETGVAIFSHYPMSDVERIVLPHAGPGKRRRVAIGATIQIGDHYVRSYSVHAETRIAVNKKMEQLAAVLDDLSLRSDHQRAVIMGDFNTIKGKDVRACIELFVQKGFTTPFPHNRPTWRTFLIELKLDWVWLRGFEASGHGIVRRIDLSDHWPLWVTVKL